MNLNDLPSLSARINGARLPVLLGLLLFVTSSGTQENVPPRQDMVSTYLNVPEFVSATGVVWCEPIPDCQNWQKAELSSAQEGSGLRGYEEDGLGTVFIFVVTDVEEGLDIADQAFFYEFADSLKEQGVGISGAAFIPPGAETDKLREWIRAQCLNCE